MKTFKSNLFAAFRSLGFSLAVLICCGVAGQAYSQAVNSGSPKYPFPHTAQIPYVAGTLPNVSSQAAMNSAVSQMYVNWYQNAVVSGGCSGCLRVSRGSANGNDTVSEGIGYGMLFAAEMADKTLFDGLYNYYYNYRDNNYLMNWQINSGGSIIGSGGATDADEDICMSLLMADTQWGSTGAINYLSAFQKIANGIFNTEIGSDGRVYSGDQYQYPYYSSYMEPAWYRCWGNHDSHGWTNVINWVYNTYFKTIYSDDPTGFMPNTANNPVAPATTNMDYDASRYPIRTGIDYLWNDASGAQTYLDAMAKSVTQSEASVGSWQNEIEDGWNISTGAPYGSNTNALQVAGALVSMMVLGNQSDVNTLWTMLQQGSGHGFMDNGFQYFQDSLCVWGALIGSGNFANLVCGVNPCAPLACTPTPTPVPLTCFMLSSPLQDAQNYNATDGYWFTFDYASVNNTPVATPELATVSTAASIVDGVDGGANGDYYSAKVSGSFDIDGGTTQVVYPPTGSTMQSETVYSGFALATELSPGGSSTSYQNLSSLQQITFWCKSTMPMTVNGASSVWLRLNFYNPNVATATGAGLGDQYGYSFAVTAANTWQEFTIPVNSITNQNWGPGSQPPVNGGVSYGFGVGQTNPLADVTSLQWQTQSAVTMSYPVSFTFWIDQVCLTFANPTATQTAIIVNTATPPPTSTPVNQPTNTPTLTPSATSTPTKTMTATNTVTSTSTATFTQTPTATPTLTMTFTATPTATPTLTPTSAFSPTSTNTSTPSSTATSTGTPTWTTTATQTPTVSNTPTITSTPTITPTPPNTDTPTQTGTPTLTSTVTLTLTQTLTPTVTLTPTATLSPTITATSTETGTPTQTPLITSTFTSTPTLTATSTSTTTPTMTWTLTSTGTPTSTPTSTSTPIFTDTSTPTFTWTFSPTASFTPTPTLTVTPTQTPIPGASFGMPQSSGSFEPGSPVTFTVPVTVTNSPASNAVFTVSPASGFNFNGFISPLPAGGTATGTSIDWASLPVGNYPLVFTGTITASSGTLPNSASFNFAGSTGPLSISLPITVVAWTPTPTTTLSPTPTQSPTSTPMTTVPVTVPIPYPNPSTGKGPISISVSFGQPTGPVHVEIFTTAFRKVQDINEGSVPGGPETWSLYLTDKEGVPLANGLYYLVISTPNGRSIGKILVLR